MLDEAAFGALYDRVAERLLVFLARRTVDAEVALDLWAETLAQAFASRLRFRGSSQAEEEAWVFGIARRQLARQGRPLLVRRALSKRTLESVLLDALTWLGHSGFRIDVGRAHVYIDPYRVPAGSPKADLILVTHGHYDHFSPQDVELLVRPDTEVIGPAQVAERTRARVRQIRPGDELDPEQVRGVSLRAIHAYNTSKRDKEGRPFHPREAGGVGFELNVRGERLYHAGDTDVIPEMDEVAGVDVALLPVSGTYVMTAGEAAEAARRIQPRAAVPMHWGEHLGTRADAVAFAEQAPVPVTIMEKADG